MFILYFLGIVFILLGIWYWILFLIVHAGFYIAYGLNYLWRKVHWNYDSLE